MSLTVQLSRAWRFGTDVLSAVEELTYEDADVNPTIDATIGAGLTDKQVACTIDLSQLKALYLESDQDVTIETNQAGGSSAAPDDVLTLSANVPKLWTISDGLDLCPLTADVDTLFVSNAGGEDAKLKIRGVQDPLV